MDKVYKGMTVNERLFVSGLMSEFEKAINERNVVEVRRILNEVELTEQNIVPILIKYGLDIDKRDI